MKCIIIDDNEIACATIKQLTTRVPQLDVAAECTSAIEAYDLVKTLQPDLLLLDIEMPGMTGIDLARQLGPRQPLIIFTTSKKEYAIEAFELNVVDYLVKPITPARFIQSIEKVKDILQSPMKTSMLQNNEFLFVRDANVIKKLLIDEILFVEAMGDYVKFHTRQKFFAVHTTMKAVEAKLPSRQFVRTHRSYLVNLGKIDKIENGVILINDKAIPVSDAYRTMLLSRLEIL